MLWLGRGRFYIQVGLFPLHVSNQLNIRFITWLFELIQEFSMSKCCGRSPGKAKNEQKDQKQGYVSTKIHSWPKFRGGFGGLKRCLFGAELFQQMEPSIWKTLVTLNPKKLQTVGIIKNPPMMTLVILVSLQPGFNSDKSNSVVI